jgi:periplasmic copper chaperone A
LRIALAFFTAISCLSVQAELQFNEAYVRGLPPGQPVTAAFMTLHNTGLAPVEIVSASSDSAKTAEIHEHLHREGMMRMQKVDSAIVPAGGNLVMKPGGYHLMLMQLHKPLKEGDTVSIQFQSKSGETFSAKLPVRSVLNEHKHH